MSLSNDMHDWRAVIGLSAFAVCVFLLAMYFIVNWDTGSTVLELEYPQCENNQLIVDTSRGYECHDYSITYD